MNIDITDKVSFQLSDDECLPLTKCICGVKFDPWTFILSIYSDTPKECPNCKAKLYFSNQIRVYQVKDEQT